MLLPLLCICWVWYRGSLFVVHHISFVMLDISTMLPIIHFVCLRFSLCVCVSPTVFVSIIIYRHCQKNNSEMSFTLIVKFVWQVFHSAFVLQLNTKSVWCLLCLLSLSLSPSEEKKSCQVEWNTRINRFFVLLLSCFDSVALIDLMRVQAIT